MTKFKQNKLISCINIILLLIAVAFVAPHTAQANQSSESSVLERPLELIKEGRTQAAVSELETIVGNNPQDQQARSLLADLYVTQNKTSKAEKNYSKVIKMNPNNAQAYNNLGIVYLKEGKTKKAMDHFRLAIEKDPKLAEAHYNLGEAALIAGKSKIAADYFQKVLNLLQSDLLNIKKLYGKRRSYCCAN